MKDYIEFKRKLTKGGGTSTSYRISIPEEIIQKMEVKSGDKVIWRLYDYKNKVEIIFEDTTEEEQPQEQQQPSQNIKNESSDIDETTEKQIKIKGEILETIPTEDKQFIITIQKNPYLKLVVYTEEEKSQVAWLGIQKREDEEIQTIISQLKPYTTKEEIREKLDEYREKKD